jgi:hypothetical protein
MQVCGTPTYGQDDRIEEFAVSSFKQLQAASVANI